MRSGALRTTARSSPASTIHSPSRSSSVTGAVSRPPGFERGYPSNGASGRVPSGRAAGPIDQVRGTVGSPSVTHARISLGPYASTRSVNPPSTVNSA